MSFPRYPKYKPSGVEWLGEIPEHWTVRPLRSLGTAYGGLAGKTAEDFTDDGPHTAYFVPFTNILNNTEIQPGRLDPVQVEPGDTQNEVRSGDLLFLMSSEDYEYLGYSAVVCKIPPQTFLNSFCKGFRPTVADANPSYLNYYCRSRFGRALISRLGFGFTRINLRTGALLSTPMLYPPLPEQRAIAAFLDRETAKIDGLVAEQQRLIELLKEKRQAVISHAVTKGLDPKAQMKPSGVEWLGDVPAHWDVRRIGSLTTKITNGFVGPTRDVLVDQGVRYLQSLHIKDGAIRFETPYFVTPSWSATHAKSVLVKGDVLVVQTGDIGQVAEITEEFVGCNCHALIILAPRTEVVRGSWISIVLRSRYGFETLRSIQTGALHPHLNCGDIRDVALPVPPLPEQHAIAAFLGRETAKIDGLIAEAESAITLLQERRSALISAAVTGQIDVRNAATTEAA